MHDPCTVSVKGMRIFAWQERQSGAREEAMEEELKNAKIIVADPLYRSICPKDSTFYEIPHVAFSGRMFIDK